MTWHLLDITSATQKEFAAALAEQTPTVNWTPRFSRCAFARRGEEVLTLRNPEIQLRRFPLQRGYHKKIISKLTRNDERILHLLLHQDADPKTSPLVCTSPFYAEVAGRWPGPVVYYQTDLVMAYDGLDAKAVRALDKRLCERATLVCPNSSRLRDYFINEVKCMQDKIEIIPNATRRANIQASPSIEPESLPADIADMPRPIAGVIGNMAANVDWCLLESVIQQTPWVSWVFVGPTDMGIAEQDQRECRERLMRVDAGRVRFVGNKPYGELQSYARAFDVAVLPYHRREPTYSGSPTRLFEHLAACRPMVATRGVAELSLYEPLVKLINTADEMRAAFCELRENQFHDGYEAVRWHTSQRATWNHRATTMIAALESRLQPASPGKLRNMAVPDPRFVRAA